MGVRVGLNYPSVIALLDVYGVKNRRSMLKKIQMIELGAIKASNELAERDKNG